MPFFLALMFAVSAMAADCQLSFTLRAGQSTRALDNRTRGCVRWIMSYNGTSPATVEHSPDGTSSWASTSFTVTSGTLPSATSFGRVEFAGYAPFIRVRATGTGTQLSVEGVVNGSQALLASAISSGADYTPPVPGNWSWATANPPTTTATSSGIYFEAAAGNDGGNVGRQFYCTNVTDPGTQVTYRMTLRFRGAHYYVDGAELAYGLALRDSSTGAYVMAYASPFASLKDSYWPLGFVYCSSGAINCPGFIDLWGGGFKATANHPLEQSFVLRSDATNYTIMGWSGNAYTLLRAAGTGNSATRAATLATYDQACIHFLNANGTYRSSFALIGWDVASP